MNELMGFELFKPSGDKPMYIAARAKSVGICAEAFKSLGCPDRVVIFFDDVKKRIMIKRAEEGQENTVLVIKHSGGANRSMCLKALAERVIAMYGRSVRIYGHQAGDGILIFDKVREQ